jgi:hypothetical protein
MRISPRYVVLFALSLAGPIGAGCGGGTIDSSGSGGTDPSTGDLPPNDVGESFTVGSGPIMPPGVWSKRYGDAEDQRALAVAVNEAGEVAVAGTAKGTIDFGNIPWNGTKTDTDVVVAKLSNEGQSLWSRRYGDSCDQRGGAVAHTPSGNVLIAGDFCGKMDFGATAVETKGAEIDAFVAMIDALGEDIYSRSFGGKGAQITRAAAVDANGDAVVVGSFDQGFDAGLGEATSAGLEDTFVVALDPKGNVLWSLTFGGTEPDIAGGVAFDELGNIVLGGTFGGSVDFGGGPLTATVGHPSSFVVKLDPSGKHLWSKSFGGDDNVVINGVAAGPGGTVAVTGSYVGTADFGGGPVTSNGAGDTFVEVMSAAGDHVWGSAFGGPKFQRGTGVAFAVNGDLAVSGTSDETVQLHELLPNTPFELLGSATALGPSMGYAITFDAAGTPIVGWEMDSGGPVECAGVGIDGKLGMVVAGSFENTLGFQFGPLVTAGGWDVFVARVQP